MRFETKCFESFTMKMSDHHWKEDFAMKRIWHIGLFVFALASGGFAMKLSPV